MKKKVFRSGPMGSLMDEYERALNEFQEVLRGVEPSIYKKKLWKEGELKSIKDICEHMERAGYGYINHFGKRTGLPVHAIPTKPCNSAVKAANRLHAMFQYTLKTIKPAMKMTDEEMMTTLIRTHWTMYDAESLWEHAVMHIHRHRRQVELFLSKV